MKSNIETRLESLVKIGKYATTDIAILEIVYAGFVVPGSIDYSDVIDKFAEKFLEMIRLMPHPTLNPVNDEILKHDEKDGPRGLKMHIKNSVSVVSREDMDNSRDVIVISAPFDLLLINVLPIFDCTELTIEHATIQTKFYREEIKEEI